MIHLGQGKTERLLPQDERHPGWYLPIGYRSIATLKLSKRTIPRHPKIHLSFLLFQTCLRFHISAECQFDGSHQNYTEIPPDVPACSTEVDLSSNNISIINNDVLGHLNNCTKLSFANNMIAHVEPNAFNGMHNLQKLYMDHNQISTITNGTFTTLNNLEELNLGDNQISVIQNDSFQELNNLKSLHLKKKTNTIICQCSAV